MWQNHFYVAKSFLRQFLYGIFLWQNHILLQHNLFKKRLDKFSLNLTDILIIIWWSIYLNMKEFQRTLSASLYQEKFYTSSNAYFDKSYYNVCHTAILHHFGKRCVTATFYHIVTPKISVAASCHTATFLISTLRAVWKCHNFPTRFIRACMPQSDIFWIL